MICSKCKKDIPDDSFFCCYCGNKIKKTDKRQRQRANGTGTVYKRGKTWTARIILSYSTADDGRILRKIKSKGGFKSRTEALEYCAVLKETANIEKKQAPRLKEYWEVYERSDLDRISEDKQRAYKIAWRRLESIADRYIDTLTVSDLRKVVSENSKSYYTAKDMKTVLTHLYKIAAADGYVSKDVPSFINLPELDEAEQEAFSVEEQKSLWNLYESGDHSAAVPLVMIYTGMMPGEILKLTVGMVNLEEKVIVGVGIKTKIRKKSPVYVPMAIVPILHDLVEDKEPEEKVFKMNEKTFYKRYYEAIEKAGCRRLTPYSCRHTTATALAINNNVAPETIRRLMRWTSTAMLKRYVHPDNSAMFEAINKII